MFAKKCILLIVFGLLIFGLRATNLNEALYDDEANFAYSLTVMDEWGYNHDFPNANLFQLLYKPLIWIFGLDTWIFRLIPLLFGMVNTLLVYLLAKRQYGKKVAWYSTLIMLLSFYPTLASLQLDVEGSIVMTTLLLLYFGVLELLQNQQKSFWSGWKVIAGLSLGLAVSTKLNAVYVVAPLSLYVLWKLKSFKKSASIVFPIFFTGFLFFAINVLFGIWAVSDNWLEVVHFFSWFKGYDGVYRNAGVALLGPIMFSLWATPLLLGFFVVGARAAWKKCLPYTLWVSAALIFYSTVVTYGSMDRYFMNTIPALALMGGILLSEVKLKKKHWLLFTVTTILSLITYYVLNSRPLVYIPRLPAEYLQQLQKYNTEFLFSYTSASGPTFGVSFATILIAFGLGTLFILGVLLTYKKMKYRYIFAVFLGLCVAYNVFLVSEYLFHPTSPDVSAVQHEMRAFVDSGQAKYPLHVTDSGLMWYFNHTHWIEDKYNKNAVVLNVPDQELDGNISNMRRSILERGGSLLMLHWPPLPQASPSWQLATLCTSSKKFYSKGILVGEIYACPARQCMALNRHAQQDSISG